MNQRFSIPKSEWGDGPWNNEPDDLYWIDETTGLPCMATRNSLGTWCGYVGVKEDDPCFDRKHDMSFTVHGGISGGGKGLLGTSSIEHALFLSQIGWRPDTTTWTGFDCAHAGDLWPCSEAINRLAGVSEIGNRIYRTIAYVKNECARLAKQIAAVNAYYEGCT